MIDRYKATGRQLTPRERELTVLLIEECNEVAMAACKLLRFGEGEHNPTTGVENTKELGMEVGDFMEVLGRIHFIKHADIRAGRERKTERLARYMQSEDDDG